MMDKDRAYGVVQTPKVIVDFMVSLVSHKKNSRVLEPACGSAPFIKRFYEYYGKEYEFFGIDIDEEIIEQTKRNVSFANFFCDDYLLWESDIKFDIIIGNPPYGIIGDKSHYPIYPLKERKKQYKKKFITWYGKYNIYGAFIEQSVRLLNDEGVLCFVVPASWLVLEDFKKLRKFLAINGSLEVYYFGKIFPQKNVSCVIFTFRKGARGLKLYDKTDLKLYKEYWNGEMIRFETGTTMKLEREGIPLETLFDIHFAARSIEFYKNPKISKTPKEGLVPVLTGRNLKKGWIDYENCYSQLWIPKEEVGRIRQFYEIPHIVVAHTKGVKVVAAVDNLCYPWREEFHLIPKYNIDINRIVDYLNSQVVQEYVSTLYKEFVPHLTLNMLKLIPIPREFVFLTSKGELMTSQLLPLIEVGASCGVV